MVVHAVFGRVREEASLDQRAKNSCRPHAIPHTSAPTQILAIPVATAALLNYARCHLVNADYYAESAAASVAAPALIRLSLLAARAQPALAQQVRRLWGAQHMRGGHAKGCCAQSSGVLMYPYARDNKSLFTFFCT